MKAVVYGIRQAEYRTPVINMQVTEEPDRPPEARFPRLSDDFHSGGTFEPDE